MSKKISTILLLFGFCVTMVYAKGTAAGMTIENSADIYYSLGGIDYNLTTNTDTFLVDQVIDIDVSWQDSSAVEVGAGEIASVLTFLLSNLGNGHDNIMLKYEHNSSNSDFLPNNPILYLDSDGNGLFDFNVDQQISDINLSADGNATLFVVSDIPSDVNAVDHSHDGIFAASDANSTAGVDSQPAVDIVIRTGSDRDAGEYIVRDFWLVTHKSAVVHNDDNLTHTGTRITYTIDLSIGGNSAGRSINSIILSDAVPSGTKYIVGSLHLDGVILSDAADSDAGSFDGSMVHVNIGTLSGTAHREVTFDVQVQ